MEGHISHAAGQIVTTCPGCQHTTEPRSRLSGGWTKVHVFAVLFVVLFVAWIVSTVLANGGRHTYSISEDPRTYAICAQQAQHSTFNPSVHAVLNFADNTCTMNG